MSTEGVIKLVHIYISAVFLSCAHVTTLGPNLILCEVTNEL